MLTYSEALDLILARVPSSVVHNVGLCESLGHVLAHPILADMNMPPFDKSFMDGYAVQSQDGNQAPIELQIVGTSQAGKMTDRLLATGEAIRIMTGAPLPQGADAVQMVEKTELLPGSRIRLLESVKAGQHVARKASEVSEGVTVLEAGRAITPAEIAVLATFGCNRVNVFKKPSVRILSTGDELVGVDCRPTLGQIRNSNSHMLAAQCRALGLTVQQEAPLADDPESIRQAIRSGKEFDLIIFSGGVSMGEYDFVHEVLRAEGIDIAFHKAAVKPGKPLIVGTAGSRLFFGLPGNPVSSFVTFLVFAKPAIEKWMGHRHPQPFLLAAELRKSVQQKPGRLFFKPAVTVSTPLGFQASPLETQGSADITAFSKANSLILVEASVSRLDAGTRVQVLPLGDFPEIPCLGFW